MNDLKREKIRKKYRILPQNNKLSIKIINLKKIHKKVKKIFSSYYIYFDSSEIETNAPFK